MKFTLNFSQSIYYNRNRFRTIVYLLVAILVISLLLQGARGLHFSRSTKVVENEIEMLRGNSDAGSVAAKKYSGREKRQISEQVKKINLLIDNVSFQWSTFLANLERVTPEGVKIRSLTPKEKGGSTQIQGVAKEMSDLRTFLDRLYRSPLFNQVALRNNSRIKVKDSVGKEHQAINFSLEVLTKAGSDE